MLPYVRSQKLSHRILRAVFSGFVAVILFAPAAGSQEMSSSERNFLSLQVQSVLPRAPIDELIIDTEIALQGSALYAKRVELR